MADPGTWMVVAMVAGAGAKTYMDEEAMEEKEEALELKRKQQESIASQQQIQRDQKMMEVQGQQLAQASAQGMSLSSGTLGALEEGSYNQFAKSSEIGKFNLEMSELSIDQQQSQLESQYWASVFGTVEDLASKGYNMSQGTGTGGKNAGPSAGNFGLSPDSDVGTQQLDMMQANERPNLVQKYESQDPFAKWLYDNGE